MLNIFHTWHLILLVSLCTNFLNMRKSQLTSELTTGHILWPATHVTRQSADPWPAWPVTQSRTMAWVDHDYWSWWIHHCYQVLFSAIWNSKLGEPLPPWLPPATPLIVPLWQFTLQGLLRQHLLTDLLTFYRLLSYPVWTSVELSPSVERSALHAHQYRVYGSSLTTSWFTLARLLCCLMAATTPARLPACLPPRKTERGDVRIGSRTSRRISDGLKYVDSSYRGPGQDQTEYWARLTVAEWLLSFYLLNSCVRAGPWPQKYCSSVFDCRGRARNHS